MSADAFPAWRQKLARALSRPSVELLIGGLIVVSAALTVAELAIAPASVYAPLLDEVGFAFTAAFALEMSLRRVATRGWGRYLALYWVDLLALLPILRVFRMAWQGGLRHTLRNALGIFSRARTGGTTEPVPRA